MAGDRQFQVVDLGLNQHRSGGAREELPAAAALVGHRHITVSEGNAEMMPGGVGLLLPPLLWIWILLGLVADFSASVSKGFVSSLRDRLVAR